MQYLASIDQSTTSTKFSIFNTQGKLLSQKIIEHQQFTPHSGWLEHDPKEIITNVHETIRQTVEKINENDKEFKVEKIKGMGVTNQRETIVAWNEAGEPYHNAIVWCDSRCKDICNKFTQKYGQKLKHKTGLPVSTYFTLFKILWLKENVPAIQKAIEQDKIRFGTIDTWVIYNLTGKYVTDASNASRTFLCNLKGEWDQELIQIAGLKKNMLPTIVDSFQVVGKINSGVLAGVQICSILGDQQSSAYAHELQKNQMKITYGTGVFMLANIGDKPTIHDSFITTILYKHKGHIEYAYQCSIQCGGGTLNWAKRARLFQQYSDLNFYNPLDQQKLYFFPAFGQIYAPFWKTGVKGGLVGINLGTTQQNMVSAILESILFRVYDCLSMEDFKQLTAIFADGGMTVNQALMQHQSDLLNKSLIIRDRDTCWGVAKGVLTCKQLKFQGFENESSFTYTADKEKHQSYRGRYKIWTSERHTYYNWDRQEQ